MRSAFSAGFLDAGAETDDLEPGRTINLPLWYIKELKVNNAYFTVAVPEIYKNVHKAVCEAETTHIELGRLHPYFYEFGRYLTPYDRNHVIGRIIFETLRQRVRHLLDISKNDTDSKPEHRLDNIESKLHDAGVRTNTLVSGDSHSAKPSQTHMLIHCYTQYINWLQMSGNHLRISELVEEHQKKRKRAERSDDEGAGDADTPSSKKRSTM